MLRSLLQDAAIAAAKSYGHPAVEPRHVLFAATRHFRSRPEIEPLFEKARAALMPHGSAIETPKFTREAEDLLAAFATEQDVIAALLKSSGNGAAPTVSSGSAAQSATPSTQAAPPAKVVDPPTPNPRETTAQVLTELEALVGLASVKRQLKSVIAVVQANQERGKAGLAQVSSGLHLVFTGPPGTGKTTVARLVARLYAAAGALPGGNFTEASRSDLVAGYVGQTAIKTADVIARTRPGVLFIDEAYSLTPTHSSDFGAEAIATLVKAMEDHRTELAIIVAGYGEEMAEFVGCNPGLKSRLKTYIDFPDFSAVELTRIFESFAKAAAIVLAPGALDAAKAVFRRVVTKRDFGNARFARSLFEQAYARMAARAVADGSVTIDEVSTIIAADVEWQETGLDNDDRSIGFPMKQ
jgi:stage V sporulation protein K